MNTSIIVLFSINTSILLTMLISAPPEVFGFFVEGVFRLKVLFLNTTLNVLLNSLIAPPLVPTSKLLI